MATSCCTSTPAQGSLEPDSMSAPESMSPLEEERLAALFKALGHPARVRILRILCERQECVCGDLVELMPLAQSTVSEHLRILKESGLIQGRVEGPRRCYCVDSSVLETLKSLVVRL